MKLTKLEKKIRNAKLDNLNHPSHPHTHHHPMPTPLPPPPQAPHAHPATAPSPHTHYYPTTPFPHTHPAHSHYPYHYATDPHLHYPHYPLLHLSARDPPIYRQECFSSYAGHSHLSPYNCHATYYPSHPIPISMPSHFVYNHHPRLLQMPNCHSAAQPSTCSPTPPNNCPRPG